MNVSYLLTGANLGQRQENLFRAREAIGQQAGAVETSSALYETAAWGMEEQPPFLNQALKIITSLSPSSLIVVLLSIEQSLGRKRNNKYGPRTIDIDILFFNHEIIHEPGLTVPHPQIEYRRFALQCLHDIAPDYIHPVLGKTVGQLLNECADILPVHKFR